MAQLTIAQLREKEVVKLATLHNANPSEADLREAHRLMNSYYRLCGLDERNLYLTNDERTCNKSWVKESTERAWNWWKRLDGEFYSFAGLHLVYSGVCATICEKEENSNCIKREVITRWFY